MRRLSSFFVKVMQRFLPDPWVLAIVLSLIVFVAGLLLTGSNPLQMVTFWGDGFFGLLEFSMQMVLILVTGYALASTALVKGALEAVAKRAGNASNAIMITTVFAVFACWLNWGFGLIVGALLAKEMARQVENVDYRLLIAAAYSGFLVWHGGLSGSIPLVIATEGHFLAEQMGVISTSQTIFTFYNLAIVLALLLALPLANRLMLPAEGERVVVDAAKLEEDEETIDDLRGTPSEALETTPWLSVIVGIGGLVYLISYFAAGGGLELNIVIFLFFMLGVLLHRTPRNYINSFVEAVRGSSGIILQFPFYAGILGMMDSSGLVDIIAGWFVAVSTAGTLPFWSFISGGVVNFFTPSGGGQWAVQGPIMIQASEQLGADLAKVSMGVAWGDAWSNMVQPFWLLPALGIAGLEARDVMGFCVMALLVSGVIITLGLLLL